MLLPGEHAAWARDREQAVLRTPPTDCRSAVIGELGLHSTAADGAVYDITSINTIDPGRRQD